MSELASLAERLNVSERTLRRAVDRGVLRARRPSPRRLEISLAEKRYACHAWPLLASLRAALRTEGNVRFALLFGSAARGEDTPRSDIDLLVEMRDDGLERIAGLSVKLEGLTGRRVDVVPVRSAETIPAVLADALADGRVLVDRDGLWPELQSQQHSLQRRAQRTERRRRKAALAGIDRMLAT
jgi:hypothetical protein